MADEAKALALAASLPLEEQVKEKSWKARKQAYEHMLTALGKAPDSDLLREYAQLLSKIVADTNQPAQDVACEVGIALLQQCDSDLASRCAAIVSSALVSKALNSRPAIVKKSSDIMLLFVEHECGSDVIAALSKAFEHKVPKVALAALDTTLVAIQQFGAKVVPAKEVMAPLPKVFDAKDAKVRGKAKEIVLELAKWVGVVPIQQSIMEKMRDTQKAEVQGWLSDLPPGKPKPERLTRSAQAKQAEDDARAAAQPPSMPSQSPADASSSSSAAQDEDTGIDAYDLMDPVDIIALLPKTFWTEVIDPKWSIRKEALSSLLKVAQTPQASSPSYHEVVAVLKKIISKDTNAACVAEAAACVAALSKCIRKPFAQFARGTFLSICLDKLKDKSTNVTNQCMHAARYMFTYCALKVTDIEEVVRAQLVAKSPKVRELTCTWLAECVAAESKAEVAKTYATMVPAVVALTADAVADARNAAFAVLAAYAAKAGSIAHLEKYLAKMDEKRKGVLMDLVGQQKPTGGARPGPSAQAPAAAPASRPASAALPKTSSTNVRRAASTASRPKTASGTATAPAGKPAPAADTGPEDEVSLKSGALSRDEARIEMQAMFGDTVVGEVENSNWKIRVSGMDSIIEALPGLELPQYSSKLCQSLARIPGWKDTNFQVLSKVCQVYTFLAKNAPSFSKKDAYAGISGIAEKVSDSKIKPHAYDALSTMSEVVSLQFVATQMHSLAAAHRNPKVLSETLMWIAQALEEFGIKAITVKSLLEIVKKDLASTNAAVRQAAIVLLGVMHQSLGSAVGNLIIPDLKPALVSTVQAHWDKNPGPPPPVTRWQRTAKSAIQQAPSGKAAKSERPANTSHYTDGACARREEEDDEEDDINLDDLMPRVDISGSITEALVTQLNSSDWKERKAGMETVERLLVSSGNRIEPTIGDLAAALKPRMADTNRNLAAAAIVLSAHIVAAMGPPFERSGRALLSPILLVLPDNKPVVRSALSEFIANYVRVCSCESILNPLLSAFAVPKCAGAGKHCALEAIRTVLITKTELSKSECQAVAHAAAIGLEDRTIEARTAATGCIAALCAICPSAHILTHGHEVTSSQKQVLADAVAKFGSPVHVAAPMMSQSAPGPHKSTGRPATAGARTNAPPLQRPHSANNIRPSTSNAASRTKSSVSVAAEANDGESVIMFGSDLKENRRVPLRSARFEPRNGESDVVKTAMLDIAAQRLHKLMFAKDFKLHCQACDILVQAVDTHLDELNACLDLLLRWAVLRFCDEKLQSILKVQAFLSKLLQALKRTNYMATDNEAGMLLPCLCDKVGHNQDRVRTGYKDLLAQFRVISNPHRMAVFVMEGMEGKNMKSRADCCDEMGEALREYGIDMLYKGPRSKKTGNALKIIAVQTSERDGPLRQAALGALMVVFASEGAEAFWTMLGDKLTQQQNDLISERQKYMEKELAKKGLQAGWQAVERAREAERIRSPSPAPAVFKPPPLPSRAYAAPQAVHHHSPPHLSDSPPPTYTSYGQGMPESLIHGHRQMAPQDTTQTPMPGPPAQTGAKAGVLTPMDSFSSSSHGHQERWKKSMANLACRPAQEQVEDIKNVFYMLVECGKSNVDEETKQLIFSSLDQLVRELTQRSPGMFDNALILSTSGTSTNPARGVRYLLNCLMQVFNQNESGYKVGDEAMMGLIAEILSQLAMHGTVLKVREGTELLRVLNILMCKVLDHSNRNHLYTGLMKVIVEVPKAVTSQGNSCIVFFMDLIVKCLVKLTKPMATYIHQGFDIEALLIALHNYFEGLGIEEIRKLSRAEDKPLRMAKTVLHELCKITGTDIMRHSECLPKTNASDSRPIIFAYIEVNMKTLRDVGVLRGDSRSASPANALRHAVAAPHDDHADERPPSHASSHSMGSSTAAHPSGRSATARTGSPHRLVPEANGDDIPTPEPGQQYEPSHQAPVNNENATEPTAPTVVSQSRPVLQSSSGGENTPEVMSIAVPDHLKPVIHEIFKKIGAQDTTMDGLDQLYQLWEEYPQLPVDRLISQTSVAFQGYIQKGLEKIRRRRASALKKQNTVNAANEAAAQKRVPEMAVNDSAASHATDVEQLRVRLKRMEEKRQ